jgi:hypothetical protein
MLVPLPYTDATSLPAPDPAVFVYAVENASTARPIDRTQATLLWTPTASRAIGAPAGASSSTVAVEPTHPERSLAHLRGAIEEALPVDAEAEARFESWLRAQEPPVRKRSLPRRARPTSDG